MSHVIIKRSRVSRRRFLKGATLAGAAIRIGLPPLVTMFNSSGTAYAAGGRLGSTLPMDRFVAAVVRLCTVAPADLTGAVLYSEDVLDASGQRRGWLGDRYL